MRWLMQKGWAWPAVVMMVGLISSAGLSRHVAVLNHERIESTLEEHAATLISRIKTRIELYQYGLRGMRGAVITSGSELSRDRIVRYSSTRDVDIEFPGARGFGFIRRVVAEDEAAFIKAARADGWPDFSIRQLSPNPGERFVIQYIEPVQRNLAAVGLDIASEANRRAAAWSSLLNADTRITGPITLVQATGSPQQSFLIMMPVYLGGHVPLTEEQRIRLGIGWSYAPLLMTEVLADLQLNSAELMVSLSDVTDPDHPVNFYSSRAPEAKPATATLTLTDTVYGRQWQFEFTGYPLLLAALNLTPPYWVLMTGSLISFLLSLAVALFLSGRKRKRELHAQQELMAAIVKSSADGIISRNCHGEVLSWNHAAEEMFGIKASDALGRSLDKLIVPAGLRAEDKRMCGIASVGGVPAPIESRRVRADGHEIDVAISYALIRNAANNVTGLSESIRDISRQKEVQNKIIQLNAGLEREVEARSGEARRVSRLLQNVLDSASQFSIIASDPQGIVTIFSRGAERMLGYSASEFIGIQSPAILHDPDEVGQRSLELESQYGGEIRGFRVFVHHAEADGAETREWTYIRKDGSRFPVSLSVTTMRDDRGEIVGYLGIAIDISESKAVAQALEKSLQTTQAILATAINPIITIDSFGTIRSINPAGETTFGYCAQEVLGCNVSMLMPEPFSSRHDLYMQRFREMTTNRVIGINREIHARRKDGSVFPVQISLGSMMVGDERLVVGIMTDITEQRAQTDALAAAMAHLSMAAEVAELGVWSWTPADNQLEWNDIMFRIYQQPLRIRETGLTYEHWQMRIHPDDRAATEAALHTAIKGEGVYNPVFRILLPDGSIRYIQAGAQVEMEEDGTVVRVTGINRDITEQLQYEARLREAKEMADAASAAKSSFLANMSHEIRTPMNAVLGMLKLVSKTGLNERQRDYVNKSQSAATSLLSLLNDILDYSKIEAGKLQLDHHAFSLDEVMRSLAIVLTGNLGNKPVEVIFDIDISLPDTLLGDRNRLLQILINLAGNALKFTEKGSVIIRAEKIQQMNGKVALRLEVSDTGIGISEDNQKKIFEGFTQAEVSTSRRFGGTGLGLVISTRLVALMGGELQLRSTLGEGSCFWFDVAFPAVEAQAGSLLLNSRPLRVLLVEDHPLLSEILKKDGQAMGWTMDLAADGATALAAVKQQQSPGAAYDLILTDWRLPDTDGVALTETINQQLGQMAPPVILISAYGREALSEVMHRDDLPFRDFLSKPITPVQLADAVRRVLSQAPVAETQSTGTSEQRLAGLRILVVEDNEMNREIAFELLQAEGAMVDLADGGLSGVNKVTVEGRTYDVVIMDMQMPDIDGLEATRRIRRDARFAQLPVLAMTANVSEQDKQACLAAGMNAHIGKPIDIDDLVNALLALVKKSPLAKNHAVNDAVEAPAEFDELAVLLRRFGNNRTLLTQMAGRFHSDLSAMLQTLAQQWSKQQWADSVITLHTLKGTAATMGARALSERCATLEQLFKSGAVADAALYSGTPGWLKELNILLESADQTLQQLLGGAEVIDDQSMISDVDWSQQRWSDALNELRSMLKANNMAALEFSEALPITRFNGDKETLQRIVDNVGQLNFPAALALLADLKEL